MPYSVQRRSKRGGSVKARIKSPSRPSFCNAAASRTIPLSPVLTSLRPVTLDGIEGAWMDWRDAQTLAAWIEDVETAR